jgi:hypothetical protein
MSRSVLATVALAAGFVIIATHTANAQQLTRGERVRIVHGSSRHAELSEGSFLSVTADSVIFRDDASKADVALSRDSVLEVERRTVVGHRALRGAGIGTLAGVVAGAGGAALANQCPHQGSECVTSLAAFFGGVGGGLLGLVSGTFIGSLVRHEDWTLVALPPRNARSSL